MIDSSGRRTNNILNVLRRLVFGGMFNFYVISLGHPRVVVLLDVNTRHLLRGLDVQKNRHRDVPGYRVRV